MMTTRNRFKRWIAPVLLGMGLLLTPTFSPPALRRRKFLMPLAARRAARSTATWRPSRSCCWRSSLSGSLPGGDHSPALSLRRAPPREQSHEQEPDGLAMNPVSSYPPRTAVFTGTFDPITLGHLDVIGRGRLLFEHLVVAIGVNLNKTSLFDIDERVEMARRVVRPYSNVSVAAFEGLTVHFVKQIGAGDSPRSADSLRHGIRIRHDSDQPPARPRNRDRLPDGRWRVFARVEHIDQAGCLLRGD